MTELIPDDRTVWVTRQIAAELPPGDIRLDRVRTPLPEGIAAILRYALEGVALGKSVSVVAVAPRASRAPDGLVEALIADGKMLVR
jgi:hypothetical protein